MASPTLDPSLPADNSPVSSAELRGQFQAIEDRLSEINGKLLVVMPLALTVSDPPTQAEVQAIADKLDELISTLQG